MTLAKLSQGKELILIQWQIEHALVAPEGRINNG